MLDRIEGLLALAVEHGFAGFEAVAITNAVFTYVLMRVEAERQVRSAAVVTRRLANEAEHLVLLSSLSDHYTTAYFDDHFEFGLQALVRGMSIGGSR